MKIITSRARPRFEAFGQHFLLVDRDPWERQWKFGLITVDSDRLPNAADGDSFRHNWQSIRKFGYVSWLHGSVYGFDRTWCDICRLEAVLAIFSQEESNAI